MAVRVHAVKGIIREGRRQMGDAGGGLQEDPHQRSRGPKGEKESEEKDRSQEEDERLNGHE